MYYKLKIDSNGFSLIEVVIAMAIFSFIIGGVVMFSVNSIKANTKSQAMQEATDNARYAIDDLAKKVRTSSNIELTGNSKRLFFVDNLTLDKYCYEFDNDQMMVSTYEPEFNPITGVMTNAVIYNIISACDNFPVEAQSIIGEGGDSKIKISGRFEVMKTDINTDTPHRGFVRIIVNIIYEGDTPESSAQTHVQTGVSLADYAREDSVL